MKFLSTLFLASTVYFVTAQAGTTIDKQVIDVACQREARIAHCGAEMVGTGLLSCLRVFNPAQLSPACRAAIGQLATDQTGVIVNPVVAVKPTYPIPGSGYIWQQHPRYGWGWYHPGFGWQLGWR